MYQHDRFSFSSNIDWWRDGLMTFSTVYTYIVGQGWNMGGDEQIESYFIIEQMRPSPKLLNASRSIHLKPIILSKSYFVCPLGQLL